MFFSPLWSTVIIVAYVNNHLCRRHRMTVFIFRSNRIIPFPLWKKKNHSRAITLFSVRSSYDSLYLRSCVPTNLFLIFQDHERASSICMISWTSGMGKTSVLFYCVDLTVMIRSTSLLSRPIPNAVAPVQSRRRASPSPKADAAMCSYTA